MYCNNCGSKLDDNSKFCKECGTKVEKENNDNKTEVKEKKKEIVKCPSCGEILDSFVARCPSCGNEIRNVGKSKTLIDFEKKLNSCPNNKKKAEFIRNFVVPASREDLLDFLFIAKANILNDDINGDHYLDEDEILLRNVWVFQLQQCYDKANLLLGGTKDLEQIKVHLEQIYSFYQQREQYEANLNKKLEINEKKELYQNSKTVKFFSILSFMCSVAAFVLSLIYYENNVLGIVFSSLMILTFVLSIVFGLQVVKTGKNIHGLMLFINFILLIPYLLTFDFGSISLKNFSSISYSTFVLKDQFPAYPNNYGIIYTNNTSCLDVKLQGEKENFTNYTNTCKEFGYVIDIEFDSSHFEAFNDGGYKIMVQYSHGIRIKIEAPMKMYNISWPTTRIVSFLPNPNKSYGNLIDNSDDKFTVYLSNFSIDEYREYVNSCAALKYETVTSKEKYYKGTFKNWFITYYVEVEYVGNNIVFISIYKG